MARTRTLLFTLALAATLGCMDGRTDTGYPPIHVPVQDSLSTPYYPDPGKLGVPVPEVPLPALAMVVESHDPDVGSSLIRVDGETGLTSVATGLNERIDGDVLVDVVRLDEMDRMHVLIGADSPVLHTYALSTGEEVGYAELGVKNVQGAFALPNQELGLVVRNVEDGLEMDEIHLVENSGRTQIISATDRLFDLEATGPGGEILAQRTVRDGETVEHRIVTIDPWTGAERLDIEVERPAKRLMRDGVHGILGLFGGDAGLEVRSINALDGGMEVVAPMGSGAADDAMSEGAVAVDDQMRIYTVREDESGPKLQVWDRRLGETTYEVPFEIEGIVREIIVLP